MLAALYVLPQQRYHTQSSIDEFTRTLLNNLEQLPGVDSVAITSFLPAAGNSWSIPFTIEGNAPQSGGLNMAAMSLVESDPFEHWAFVCSAGASLPSRITPAHSWWLL
jgi:hypothetical protein